ncbi:MAG TPA: stage II sporulation protein M, partial [Nakamurella sp.]
MDLDAYVAEHAGNWRRLDRLSRRRRLSVDEVDEMMGLYQRTGAQLSVIRSKAPDALLIAWLSRVVLAARGRITGTSASWTSAVGRFFVDGFPLVVYQARRWWLTVMAVFVSASGALIAYIATHPQIRTWLVPDDAAKQLVQHDFKNYYSEFPAHHFALEVWTNNALLTGECLAAGALIVPVLYLLADNILNVGVDGGVMVAYGKSGEFFGLILPHGMLELTAVFIAAGAGLRIGWAFIAPPPG